MRKWYFVLAIGIFVALTGTLLWQQSKAQSPITDEVVHLPAGYTYWQQHDFRVNPEHPILVKLIAAIPWILETRTEPIDPTFWTAAGNFYNNSFLADRKIGEQMLFAGTTDPQQTLAKARYMMTGVTLLFIIGFVWLVWRRGGPVAALIAAVLSCFNPQFLGYGHFVTTDIAIMASAFLAAYWFYRYREDPTWNNAVIWGATIGLMMLTKYTAIIFLLLFGAIAVFDLIAKPTKYRWLPLLATLATAYVVILITYLPETFMSAGRYIPLDDSFGQLKNPDQVMLFFYNTIHLPLYPINYVKGMLFVITHAETGHSSYLFGHLSRVGWWYYFPVAFFLKNSLALFALIILVAKKDLLKKWTSLEKLCALLIVGYFLVAMNSKANLGVRHLMPVYPFLFYILAMNLSRIAKKRVYRYAIGGLLLIYALSVFRAYPSFITYFSEVVGNPANGAKSLADSNVDWGQELPALAKYQDENHIDFFYLEYFWDGLEALDYYGIDYQMLDSNKLPAHGTFAIGASSLFSNPNLKVLRDSKPTAVINNSVYIYTR